MFKNLDKYLIIGLGLFSITWGLFWLYKPLFFTFGSQYNIFGEIASGKFTLIFEDSIYQWIGLLGGILVSFLLVKAGIGLIKLKPLAGSQFWLALLLHESYCLQGFIRTVGWSGNETIVTLNIFFILFSILLFLWPKVSERFPNQKLLKWKSNFPFMGWQIKPIKLKLLLQWGFIFLVIFFGVAYSWWKTVDWFHYPPLEQVDLLSANEVLMQDKLIFQDFPFGFSIGLPQETRLRLLLMHPDTWNSFVLSHNDSKDKLLLYGDISDRQMWGDSYQLIEKHLGYKNEYEFARKIFSEHFAFTYLVLKKAYFIFDPVQIWETQVNGLNVFISEVSGSAWEKYYRVSVFFEGKHIGEIDLKKIDQKLLASVLSTIRPQGRKTAKEYYDNGVRHIELKDFEAANFSFASAIYVKPEIPDYHFAYGKLNLEIWHYYVAVKALEKVIELQPGRRFKKAPRFIRG